MGMFDYFVPEPALRCPNCAAELDGFQGKDGPCGLFVWMQSVAHPVEQSVDDEYKLSAAELETLRLPQLFEFYTDCSRCSASLNFTGVCADGVWNESVLGSHLRIGPTIPARSVAANWRQCSQCAEAWEISDAIIRAGCPGCGALTRLEPA